MVVKMDLNSNSIFVFVPGAWHTPDTFDIIRDVLAKRGYASEAVTMVEPEARSQKMGDKKHDKRGQRDQNYGLSSYGSVTCWLGTRKGPVSQDGLVTEAVRNVSVGATDTSFGLLADVAHTKSVIQTLADQGRQIVVVNHSYGGLVGAGAVEGLGLKQRAQAGFSGGVIQVVWMAAFVAPKGMSVIDMLGGDYLPWMFLKDPDDGYCYSSQEETIFYHDMTPEAQKTAISKLKPHAKPSFHEKAVYEPWHDMPSFYLFCDQDKAVPLQLQEGLAQTLGNPGTHHADGSHSAFLSVPDQVADGLELALKEGLEKTA